MLPIRRLGSFLVLLLSPAFITGCSTFQDQASKGLVVETPFVQQDPFECGVATLEMVFKRLDVEHDTAKVRKMTYLPILNGTTLGVMADTARKHGVRATITHGNNMALADWLSHDLTPIVYWGPKKDDENIGHFLLVTALSENHHRVRVHSGEDEDRWVSLQNFMSRWAKGEFKALLIDRPDVQPST